MRTTFQTLGVGLIAAVVGAGCQSRGLDRLLGLEEPKNPTLAAKPGDAAPGADASRGKKLLARFSSGGEATVAQIKMRVPVPPIEGRIESLHVHGALWKDEKTDAITGSLVVRVSDHFDLAYGSQCDVFNYENCELVAAPNSAQTEFVLTDIQFRTETVNGAVVYTAQQRDQRITQRYRPEKGTVITRDLSEIAVFLQLRSEEGGAFAGLQSIVPGPVDGIRTDAAYAVPIVMELKGPLL